MATVADHESANELNDVWTLAPFLRRVRIRGFKSIAFCDVPLQPLTILVGRNAAGKSNFLEALAFLRDVMKFGVSEAVKMESRGGWSALVCRSSDNPRIEYHLELGFKSGRMLQKFIDHTGIREFLPVGYSPFPDFAGIYFIANYNLEISLDSRSSPIISKESLKIDADDGKSYHFDVRDNIIARVANPTPVDILPSTRPDQPLLAVIGSRPFMELGDGLRFMTFYNLSPDSIRKLSLRSTGFLVKNGENLASVIESLNVLQLDSPLDRVKDYLKIIVPEIQEFNVIKLGDYETVQFRQRGENGRSLEFNSAQMSDGTLRALATLIAAFQVVLPHGYPSVVGIEEPETALHPAAMRALVDALDDATQRTQILLTTHSADLLSGRDVKPGQVLIVRNRGGRTHITPIDPASREIIEKELYSLADLQRMDELDLDESDLKRQELLSQNGGA